MSSPAAPAATRARLPNVIQRLIRADGEDFDATVAVNRGGDPGYAAAQACPAVPAAVGCDLPDDD